MREVTNEDQDELFLPWSTGVGRTDESTQEYQMAKHLFEGDYGPATRPPYEDGHGLGAEGGGES